MRQCSRVRKLLGLSQCNLCLIEYDYRILYFRKISGIYFRFKPSNYSRFFFYTHWGKIQSKELRMNGLVRKKNMEDTVKCTDYWSSYFRGEGGGVYLDRVFVGPDPVHLDTCITHSVGFYALFDPKDWDGILTTRCHVSTRIREATFQNNLFMWSISHLSYKEYQHQNIDYEMSALNRLSPEASVSLWCFVWSKNNSRTGRKKFQWRSWNWGLQLLESLGKWMFL